MDEKLLHGINNKLRIILSNFNIFESPARYVNYSE